MNNPERGLNLQEEGKDQTHLNQPRPLLESLQESWQLIWTISLVGSSTLTLGAMGLVHVTGAFSTPLVDIETGFKLLAGTALVHTVVAGTIKLTELAYNVQRNIHHPHK